MYMNDRLMTLDDAAEYLRLKKVTLYKLLEKGKLPGSKVGGQWRFKKDTLEKWIDDKIVGGGVK